MGKALELQEGLRISIFESLVAVTGRGSNKMGEGELFARCPVHGEDNPSFSYNYNKDIYFCFSCGATGDLIKLWCLIKGFPNSKEGFISFCREYGLGDSNGKNTAAHTPCKKKEAPVEAKKLVKDLTGIFKSMPPVSGDWDERLVKERGWSVAVIREYDLKKQTKYQKDGVVRDAFWEPDRVVIPIYENGIMPNMRLYRPFASKNGSKGHDKIISWSSGTGDARLFPEKPKYDGPVLFCEGESDCLCALSKELNAITQTSKPKNWPKEQLEIFRDKDVTIAFDADIAGQKYALEFAAPALAKVARNVNILEWPDYMGRLDSGEWPNDHGQDLTDFFVKHRKSKADLEALIAEARPYDSNKNKDFESEAAKFFKRGVTDKLAFKPRLLADRLMERIQLMHDPKSGLLHKWNGRYWQTHDQVYLSKAAMDLLGEESHMPKIVDAIEQIKLKVSIPADRTVNDLTDWICVKNGMVNIRTGDIKPHSPDYFATFELPVVFDPDSTGRCETLLKFLETNIESDEPIAQIQEFVGCCLDRTLSIDKCLWLFGPGADGKSVLCKLVESLIGDDNCASVGIHELDDQYLRAMLYQKSLCVYSEMASKAFDTQYFKAIVTGDSINARFPYGQPFSFRPYCKLIYATNKLPKSLDNSDGFFRRLLPVEFKKQYLQGNPDKDPYLLDKLKAELSEIFQWALVGLHRYREQQEFTDCDETQGLLMKYRRENNPVLCFMEDCLEFNAGYSTSRKQLYEAYKKYCFEGGNHPFARESFFRELKSLTKNLSRICKRVGDKRENFVGGVGLIFQAD